MAVVGPKPERCGVDCNVVAAGVCGADPDVDVGKCCADIGDQSFGLGPGPVMDSQCRGPTVRQRIGESGAGAAGPSHVKSLAFDLMTLLDQSTHKAVAVQQRTAEAAIWLAAYGVDDPGVHAVAFEFVAKPGRLRLVRRGNDKAVEVHHRVQTYPGSRPGARAADNRRD